MSLCVYEGDLLSVTSCRAVPAVWGAARLTHRNKYNNTVIGVPHYIKKNATLLIPFSTSGDRRTQVIEDGTLCF